MATPHQPILLRADDDYVHDAENKAETVLGNALMAQTLLVSYYEDTIPKVQTPWLKERLQEYHERAEAHQRVLEELSAAIHREPSRVKAAMGGAMTGVQELMAHIVGFGAGAYHDLQMLFLLESLSTAMAATVAQIGVALGVPDLRERAMPIVMEKFGHWRFFEETALELAPLAVLEDHPI